MQNSKVFQFSYFRSCKANVPTAEISLEQFINDIRSDRYTSPIEALRAMNGEAEQKAAKKKLPAATISGIFAHRNIERLLSHSHVITLDFDHLTDPAGMVQQAAAMPFVLAAFISPRGQGCKVLAHSPGNDHLSEFLALQSHFETATGHRPDDSGKDVTRLCFVSYDPAAYFNPAAEPFTAPPPPAQAIAPMGGSGAAVIQDRSMVANQEAEVVSMIEEIERRQIDVTRATYDTWLKFVVFPFAHAFGSTGLAYLHRVSRFSTKYTPDGTERQYEEALKGRQAGRKIESFFQLCKEHGIYAKDSAKATASPPIGEASSQKKIPMIAQVEAFLQARYTFRRNVVNEKIEAVEHGSEGWQEVNENAISRLLEHNFFSYGPNKTASLLYSDFVEPHNPFTSYFDSLQYSLDEGSYIEKVCQMVKVKDQARFNRHFRKMLIRCVACSTIEEKTNHRFNKHIFTLVSPKQSVGKTSFTRWLCPPALGDYYTETFDSSKDGKISLSTMFIINLDELASLAKHDINQLKALVSLGSINERLPYGKHRQFYPRRANFFGSTNNEEFLTDNTGNVRWLCFEVQDFTPGFWQPGSKNFIDINRVWAEAKYLYSQGESYQLTTEEKGENEEANQEHRKTTIEEELIMKYCEPDLTEQKENHRTASDVLEFLAGKTTLASKVQRDNIGRALTSMGYIKKAIKQQGISVYGYFTILK